MITSSGLISGIDTKTLISQLIQLERQPIIRLQRRQSAIQTEISSLGKVSSAMSELTKALEGLSDRAGVLAYKATSSNEDAAKLTATGDASQGQFSLTIQKLAQAEKQRSAAFVNGLGEVKAGTLDLAVYGEDPVSIELAAGASLTDVRDAINASGASVSATIVNTGSSAYLSLTANKTGHEVGGNASDAIVITETYTGSSGQELSLFETQTARNALFELDGLAIEQSSNLATEVVDGLTFELIQESTAPITLTVSPNPEGINERLTTFVNTYNSVIDGLRRLDDGATYRLARSRFDELLSAPVAGVSGAFTTLASVGVKLDYGTGRLSLDGDKLSEAAAADAGGLARLFTTPDTGVVDALSTILKGYTNTSTGVLKLTQKNLGASTEALDRQIELRERSVSRREEALVRQFTALESLLAGLQSQESAFLSMVDGLR